MEFDWGKVGVPFRRLAVDAVRLQIHAVTFKPATFLRTLALPVEVRQ